MNKLVQATIGELKNPALWAASAGILTEAFLEKTLWTQRRDLFGYAVERAGQTIYLSEEEWRQGTATVSNQGIRIKRQAARAALLLLGIGGAYYLKRRPEALARIAQGALLGVSATAAAHAAQELVPALNKAGTIARAGG